MVNHTLKGMPSTLEYLTVMYFSQYNNSILKERENWNGDISDFGWYGTVSHTNQILKDGKSYTKSHAKHTRISLSHVFFKIHQFHS